MAEGLFGDVLRELLGGTRVRELADAINVEQGVVYRWLRNERTPRLGTSHVADIARCLRLNARQIGELKRAQVTSLEMGPATEREQREKRKATARDAQGTRVTVRRFLEHAQAEPTAGAASTDDGRGHSTPPTRRPLPVASSPVRGRLDVISRVIELLESAPEADLEQGDTILVSVQGRRAYSDHPNGQDIRRAWQAALQRVLARGWSVEQLWRLDRNVDRSVRLVDTMLNFIGSGRYWPRYFDRYGTLDPAYDVVVVPGHAAALLLATDEQTGYEGAYVFTRPEEIDLAAGHFRCLRAHTRPLLRGFLPPSQEIEYTRALVEAENVPGGRLIIKSGPSGLTHPPQWWRPESPWASRWVETGIVTAADLPEYLDCLHTRFQHFQRYVRDFDYRDVCSRRALDALAESGTYDPDDPQSGHVVPPEMRLEHLRNMAEMLKAYDRFQVALLDAREEQAIRTLPAREVTGGDEAFIATWSRDASEAVVPVALHITEPTIVGALREHFDEVWSRIAEAHCDKRYVIGHLERHIAALEAQG